MKINKKKKKEKNIFNLYNNVNKHDKCKYKIITKF